jgi:uncharacterized protein (DUF1810 family)
MTLDDPFELARFVKAQADTYETALAELQSGVKRSHWIWFIFPQMKGLGQSSMSHRYGIGSLQEAEAYLAHPLLGPRLEHCTRTVLAIHGASLSAIFGTPDDMKFRSCMTLFAHAARADSPYRAALNRWCDGVEDHATLALLK